MHVRLLSYVFSQMDADNDGSLDEDEVLEGLTTILETANLEVSIEASTLKTLIFKLDLNKSGQIEHPEFFACLLNRELLATVANLEAVFYDIDVNRSNSLSLSELKRGLPLLANEDDNSLRDFMKSNFDLIDNQVPKSDFIAMMKF